MPLLPSRYATVHAALAARHCPAAHHGCSTMSRSLLLPPLRGFVAPALLLASMHCTHTHTRPSLPPNYHSLPPQPHRPRCPAFYPHPAFSVLPKQAPLSSPADDIHGQLRYTVEVVDLQINAEAEAAQVCVPLYRLCCNAKFGVELATQWRLRTCKSTQRPRRPRFVPHFGRPCLHCSVSLSSAGRAYTQLPLR